jgi:hypothetical protein
MIEGAPVPYTPPHYSLNRVRVVDLPGIVIDAEVRGQTGFGLLSAWALMGYARECAAELELPPALLEDTAIARWELPRLIGALLAEGGSAHRRAAEAVARRMGRNLGHVLLALRRGDLVNREARPDWGDAEWHRWSMVRRVWLAGGLAAGDLGRAIQRAATEWLAAADSRQMIDISLSPWSDRTAVVGAARYLPPISGAALCCDYGQTSVKRAVIEIDGNRIVRVTPLSRIPARDEWREIGDGDPAREGQTYREFVGESICDALWRATARGAEVTEIMLSFAAYVDGGRLLGTGPYAAMNLIAPDARQLLAGDIFDRTGVRCRIGLIHDGTAAAAAFAGDANSVTIAMGSALGVGFPPDRTDHLLRIDDLFDTRYE